MEVDNFATVRRLLAWWLLAATVIALTGTPGATAAVEAGNATFTQQCRGSECLIAYQQPEVELDPEHALGGMLASLQPGAATGVARNQNTAGCGRNAGGQRYTPCTPPPNPQPHPNPYPRNP